MDPLIIVSCLCVHREMIETYTQNFKLNFIACCCITLLYIYTTQKITHLALSHIIWATANCCHLACIYHEFSSIDLLFIDKPIQTQTHTHAHIIYSIWTHSIEYNNTHMNSPAFYIVRCKIVNETVSLSIGRQYKNSTCSTETYTP